MKGDNTIMLEELEAINELMETNADNDYDIEMAHMNADEYLISALELISNGTEYENVVNSLIENFRATSRWYA